MIRLFVRVALALSMVCGSAVCLAEDVPLKFSYRVFSSDETSQELLSEAIRKRFEEAKLPTTRQFPAKSLYVYAERNIGSNVNSAGWTFAVAHVTNQMTYYAAAKIIPLSGPGIDEAKPALIKMLNEHGFLSYMSAAGSDDLSESTINVLADGFVAEFLKRTR